MNNKLVGFLLDLHQTLEKKSYKLMSALQVDGSIGFLDNELQSIVEFISKHIGMPNEEIFIEEGTELYEKYLHYLDIHGCVSIDVIYEIVFDYTYKRISKEKALEELNEIQRLIEDINNDIVHS